MTSSHQEKHVDALFALLEGQGSGSDYIGESISQLEHFLQAAHFAKEDGADEETIVAALFHDVGQILPESTAGRLLDPESGKSVGRQGHDAIGEAYLRKEGWPDRLCSLVGAHVEAKRYLTACEPGYLAGLSSASQTSLRLQGGPFTRQEVQAFQSTDSWREKVSLRLYDDRAKVVGLQTEPLEAYRDMALRVLRHNCIPERIY
ncbi:hypothetical protein FA10DRAFT_244311 [Acaromyces ingoldii]|uniref:HD domain-containing protein n=1 Tax=Acaromyces ingoldii TaxID=215250 RepID=A0A316YHL7_9BASI|nr:hypothetical protein FA10DRAFT_244311 [Acaromyces ingoldii]PWN88662.1 hypothetical protein FA10DRAFT_244311 [Acaromyces ingoldii]